EFTFCPSSWISVYPSSAICRASCNTDCDVRLRSFPRVNGTTQYAQNLSHPSMIVMYPRCGFRREVNSVSKHLSVCRSSSPVMRTSSRGELDVADFPSVCSTAEPLAARDAGLATCSSFSSISGSFVYDADPHTSDTCGARSKIFSPSCCATQPSTPNFLPAACSFLKSARRWNTFCSALSRIEQVL